MLLDQVMASQSELVEKIESRNHELLDEIAYVALVGLLGVVPEKMRSGVFMIGQLAVPYEWRTSTANETSPVLTGGSLELVLTGTAPVHETTTPSIISLVSLWAVVQERSDALAYWPPEKRKRWISAAAETFQTTDEFVRNLMGNYPQLRRLCA